MGFDPVSYLLGKQSGGGGSSVTVEALSVTENGVYTAPTGKAYSPVTVAVPIELNLLSTGTNLQNFLVARRFNPPIDKVRISSNKTAAIGFNSICSDLVGVKEVVVDYAYGVTNFANAFDKCEAEHITINVDTSQASSFIRAFRGNAEKEYRVVVDGNPIDLSGTIADNSLLDIVGSNVTEIRFVPNTARYNFQINQCVNASDATLISIANALDGTATGLTLTLHATPKARCQTLMGTVADGVFTADASGTVTLADFITTMKGWTLA